MKVVVVHGPKDLRVEEVAESPVGLGEVAVDIAYESIRSWRRSSATTSHSTRQRLHSPWRWTQPHLPRS